MPKRSQASGRSRHCQCIWAAGSHSHLTEPEHTCGLPSTGKSWHCCMACSGMRTSGKQSHYQLHSCMKVPTTRIAIGPGNDVGCEFPRCSRCCSCQRLRSSGFSIAGEGQRLCMRVYRDSVRHRQSLLTTSTGVDITT